VDYKPVQDQAQKEEQKSDRRSVNWSMDRSSEFMQVINYFFTRGEIFLRLEMFEQAQLSFVKVLSVPYSTMVVGE